MMDENKSKKATLNRGEIHEKYKWDIDSMYSNEDLWEEDYHNVTKLLNKISNYEGRLNESSDMLLEALRLRDEISSKAENIFVYSKMKKDEDNRVSKYQGLYDKAVSLSVEIQSTFSFVVPEILNMEKKRIYDFMEENEDLRLYKFYLDELLRQKNHVLSESEEKILAMMGEVSHTAKNIYSMLLNADIKFPTIKDSDGGEIEITKGNFVKLLESKDRNVRENAFKGLYSSYENLKNTFGTVLSSSVKKDNFYAKVRRYNSALEASLDDDNISVDVYNNLIKTVRNRIDLMHRYVSIRKKALKLDELHMYDLYTPLVNEAQQDIDYDSSIDIVKQGLKPLGKEYSSIIDEAFKERWIDVYENSGKTTGAYSWGTYNSKPYILLNYQNSIKDVFTLAHEMGHSIHSYLSNKNQPYIYSSYKIFVAEVASTVNEALLMNYLLNKTENKTEKLYLLNHFLEQFRATVYRQTMFAEFEKAIHQKAQEGEAITPDVLCEYYYSLNEFYYGEDIVIDEEIKYEWARIPHFYNPFYVYKYATGHSAAIALSRKILKEGDEAIDKYIDFLKSGGSNYPIDLLKGAGIDMATTQPIENALKVFEKLLDEFEELIE